jgi:hypothetical protein
MLEGMLGDDERSRTRSPSVYRIEVKGAVPGALVDNLDGFTVHTGPNTALTGPVRDTAELYGLIARLEMLGLVLISVQPVNRSATAPHHDG